MKDNATLADDLQERIRELEAVLIAARGRVPHVILPSEMAAAFQSDAKVNA